MRGEPTTLSVNDDFVDRIQNAFGEAGEAWISRLPKILEAVAERWSLSIESPFKDLFYSYIAPVLSADGEDLVLKLGVPNQALGNEIAALQAFDGRGMVKLIDSNAELGALLLERLGPGKPLTILTDRKATSIASELIRQLQEVDAGEQAFPSVRDWGNCFEHHRETFDGGAGPFSESLLNNADWLFSELNMSAGEDILLHGDLHH